MFTMVVMCVAIEHMGQRLREAREAIGISARELDRRAGLTEGHTSLLEGGRNMEVGTAAKLAIALGVSLDWLVFGDSRPTNND